MKKLLCLFCGCILLLSFAACKQKNTDPQVTQTTTDTEEPAAELLELAKDGASRFEVICPEIPTKEENSAALTFIREFKQATGVELKLKNNLSANPEKEDGSYKILIGKTGYAESDEAYEGVRCHDFRVAVKGNCISVAAFSKDGFDRALDWFRSHVFQNVKDGTLKMERSGIYEEFKDGYAVKSWTVSGVSLEKFRLVYSDAKYEKEVRELHDRIAQQTGYVLPVVRDTKSEPAPYEILLGDTNREESLNSEKQSPLHYLIRVDNGKLVVKTGGEQSFANVLDRFLTLVAEDLTKVKMGKTYELTGDFFDDPYDSTRPDDATIRIMDANVMANLENYDGEARDIGFSFARRLEIFFAHAEFYRPDVIGVQEFCHSWVEGLDQWDRKDQWGIVKFPIQGSKDNMLTCILYNQNTLTLVDSGIQHYSARNNDICRCITWAILKDNRTNREFCFVSTHWDGGYAEDRGEMPNTLVQVKEISEFVNKMAKRCPVFTTGDFNRNEFTDSFKDYLVKINSTDAMYSAVNRINKVASWHDWGKPTPSVGSCDHITATKNTTVLQFETLMYNDQIYASDHAWLLADIRFD